MPDFVNFSAEKRQSTTIVVESERRQWYRSVRQAVSRLDGTHDAPGNATPGHCEDPP